MLFDIFYFIDTKNTQWEDPRLQNAAITGPVSMTLKVVVAVAVAVADLHPLVITGSALL